MNRAILSILALVSVGCVTQLDAHTFTFINERGKNLKNVEVRPDWIGLHSYPKRKFNLKKGKSKSVTFGGPYVSACLMPIKIDGEEDEAFKAKTSGQFDSLCRSAVVRLLPDEVKFEEPGK